MSTPFTSAFVSRVPAASDYLLRIRALDWDGIERLWTSIRSGRTPGWPLGKALEHLVLRAFELDGATVRWPFGVWAQNRLVEQIDGVVYAANLSFLVEVKDTAAPVQGDAIAKLRNQLIRRPAGVLGLLFSRSAFTESAEVLAQLLAPQNVLLWTGDDLSCAIERRGMVWALEAKYRYCVEEGIPNRELRMVMA